MEQQPRRRRRPPLSCVQCRRRKVKCDRSLPCSRCLLAAIDCAYSTRSAARICENSVPHTVGADHIDAVADYNNGNAASETANNQVASLTTTQVDHQPNTAPAAGGDYHSSADHQHKSVDAQSSNGISKENSTQTACSTDLVGILDNKHDQQASPILLNKTRTLRWSHKMGMSAPFIDIIKVYKKMYYSDHKTSQYQAESGPFLCETRNLIDSAKKKAQTIKTARLDRISDPHDISFDNMKRETATDLAKAYFRCFESVFRILHPPMFWIQYERCWSQPNSQPYESNIIILLVLAIGCSLSEARESAAIPRDTIHKWIHSAQCWLSGPLAKNRLSIPGLQVHCLVILARQVFGIGGELLWISTGSLVNSAMQMGLHRSPEHLPKMSSLQTQLRRRLWATILEMVVQSSLDSAMPPRIAPEDFDAEPPLNIDDEHLQDTNDDARAHPVDVYTTSSLQIALFKSFTTRLRVVQFLNSLRANLDYKQAIVLSTELVKEIQDCQIFLERNEAHMTPFHGNIFDYLVRRFLLPLHSSFAAKADECVGFQHSSETGLATALAIISPFPDPSYLRLMAIGGGLFRESIRHASTAIGMELLKLTRNQKLDGTLSRVPQRRDQLKQALRDVSDLVYQRVEGGDTNIKSHMYLAMILAQVEAMEQGVSGDVPILRAARDSLVLSLNVLQRHEGSQREPSVDDGGLSFTVSGDWDFRFDADIDWLIQDNDAFL